MPETTENYHRIPNPNYAGTAFEDNTRTITISAEKGIKALYAPLKRTGGWKVRTFLFVREKWPNMAACQTWVREHKESFKGITGGFETIWTGETEFVRRAEDSAPTADELEVINGYALKPLTAEEVYVREMRLTNDQWSRDHMKRLSRGFQRSILNDMPGKSLLLGHPEVRGLPAIPEGVFFEGWEDFDQTRQIAWGKVKFYVVKTAQNEHLRAQIDGGVYKHASLGMKLDEQQCSICGNAIFSAECPHIPGQTYPRTEVKDPALNPQGCEDDPERVYCGVVFRGMGTALEGSIVFWPALHGTQIVAEAQLAARQGDFAAAKGLLSEGVPADAGDALPDPGRGVADTAPGTDGGSAHNPEEEGIMTPEEVKVLEMAKAEAEGKVATLEAEKTELAAKASEAEPQLAALQGGAEQAKAFRGAVIEDLKRLAGLLKREAELETFGAALEDMPPDKLLALQTDWTKQVDEQLSGGRQSTPTERDGATGDPTGDIPGGDPDSVPVNLAFVG